MVEPDTTHGIGTLKEGLTSDSGADNEAANKLGVRHMHEGECSG